MSASCASPLERRPTTGRSASPQSACACHDKPTVEAGLPRFLGPGGFQGKLEIGAVDDPLEQEADAFAQAVSHDETALPRFMARDRPAAARRLCDDCAHEAVGELAEAPAPTTVQRESLKPDPPVDGDGQGGAGHGGSAAGPGDGADEPGKPLPPSVRPRLESSLGLDLGAVRVHADATAAKAARSLGAKAFTHGRDIWLGSGQSADDLRLMAHEVAHVVQQDGTADAPIRRAPADYRHPEDGGNVAARMQARLSAADHDQAEEAPADPAARAHDARSSASQIDRGELAAERAEIEPDARPDVDRPAAEGPKVEQARAETTLEADSPTEPLAEATGDNGSEGGEGGKGDKGGAASAADTAAALAEQAFGDAQAATMPSAEAMVMPPPPVVPVDAAGQPLPANPDADAQVSALASQAQSLREEGTRVAALGTEERANAAVLAGNIALVRGGIAMAEQGVGTSRVHLATRQELTAQARSALAVSEQKAATVAAEAPTFASRADEGKAESGPMASEAGQLSADNAANTPDDPEAAANAREQGGQMDQAGAEIGTTDDAITRTQEKSASLGEDAARAQQTNTETAARLDSTDEQLITTGEKLDEMTEQSAAARASVEALASAPDMQRQQAGELAGRGGSLVSASFDIENRLVAVQRDYAQAMQAVPAAEAPAEEEAAPTAVTGIDFTPDEARALPAALEEGGLIQRTPDETVAAPPEPSASPVAQASPASEEATAPPGVEADVETPAEATNNPDAEGISDLVAPAAAPERERVDAAAAVGEALPDWMTGVTSPSAEQREEAAAAAETKRAEEIAEIEALAGGEFENLSAADKMGIALRMTGRNLFGSVSEIQWPGWGHLALGLIDPRGPLMGVVSGLGMMLSGGANLLSGEQWRRDPLGNLLKSAADIATGLTVILGSITALAGVIIAIMVAITLLSFGTAAPITGPVIAFCTTVLTTVGGWTIAVGKVALVLQALVFIKNLIDAACADTAAELQSESQQLTENVGDAANVVMQMGMAKAGQLGGRAASAEIRAAGGGVRYAAGMGARAGVGLRAAPGAALRGTKALPGLAARGVRALPGAATRGLRAAGRGIAAVPGLAARGARGVGRGLAGGARSLARGTAGLGRRAVAGARALPARVLAGARALPARIAAAPGQLLRGARNLPARLRAGFGDDLSRGFLLGEDIANPAMARTASAEARAAVWAEARAPGGALGRESRIAAAADEGGAPAPRERVDLEDTRSLDPPTREASVRESGRLSNDELSPQQLRGEVDELRAHPERIEGTAPNRRAEMGEHQWREDGRRFCRFSPTRRCVDADEITPGGAAAKRLDDFQHRYLDELGEELDEIGAGWRDLGFADDAAMRRAVAASDDVEDAMVELGRRVDRTVETRRLHAEQTASPEVAGAEEMRASGLRRDDPRWSRSAAQIEENRTFGKMAELQGERFLQSHFDDVVPQVRIRPRLDNGQPAPFYFIADNLGRSRAGGQLLAFDSKLTSTAPLTPNQAMGYPLLARNGGIVESRAAGSFGHGMELPPTQSFRLQPRFRVDETAVIEPTRDFFRLAVID